MAAYHLFFFQAGRGEGGDDFGEQVARVVAVVTAEVADIDVQRDAGDFRPGMNRQMRFGEHDGARDAGRIAGGVLKCVEQAADHGQAVARAAADTEGLEFPDVEKEFSRAAAVVEVSDQVQAVHMTILWRFTWNPVAVNVFEQVAKPVTRLDDTALGNFPTAAVEIFGDDRQQAAVGIRIGFGQ